MHCKAFCVAVLALALSPFPTSALAQDRPSAANPFRDYGEGIMLRRNPAIAQALSGYSWVYVSTYNGGAGGGMATQATATFCGGNTIHFVSESSVSMGAGSAFGNSSSRENDAGAYEVLEDRAGNTFLHLTLNTAGDKYMHFRLEGTKLLAGGNLPFTRYQRVC